MKHMWKRPGLMSVVTILAAIACVPVGAEVSEWVDLGVTNASSPNGLTCFNEGVALNGADTLDGVECRKTVLASNTLAFDVNDSWAFEGNRRSVCIAIEYYDSTSQTLRLEYDSLNGVTTEGGRLFRSGTNSWKTHLWCIEDAYFGNRQPYGGDFRLLCSRVQTFINRV